jgi:hypothetical protein
MTGFDYTILSDYFTTVSLDQDVRTQMRLEGHSSNLFEYYVPHDASDGFARAITFTIESDDEYNPIDVYFSLDSQIYQVEERKQEGYLSNGVGYYFTENDYGWCNRSRLRAFSETSEVPNSFPTCFHPNRTVAREVWNVHLMESK